MSHTRRASCLAWLVLAFVGAPVAVAGIEPSPGSSAPAASPPPAPIASASVRPSAFPAPSSEPASPLESAEALRWTPLESPEGPPPREDHTLTVDGQGTTAWLFGGRDGGRTFGDLWQLDLLTASWQEVSPPDDRPSARFGHAAAWVDGVGVVVFAGQSRDGFLNDLWAWDPLAAAWRRLPSDGRTPDPRYGTCAALGPDGRLWISHGFTADGRFDDTRAYDFSRGRWELETPGGERPVVRCLHDCVWSSDGRLLLFGGQTNGRPALGDLWSLDPVEQRWVREPSIEPAPRQLYALAATRSVAWIHGGRGAEGGALGDTWRLDLVSRAFREVEIAPGPGPSSRSGATLVVDVASDRLLLFGGEDRTGSLADLWSLAAAP